MNSANLISHVYTPEEMETLRNEIKTFKAKFTAVVGQSVAEKKSLIKIEGNNKSFVEDCFKLMQMHPDHVPAHVKVEEVNKDILYHAQLDEFILELNELLERMRSTQMRAGHEAYKASLEFYNSSDRAAKAGVAGAVAIQQQLKPRFARQGNRTAKKEKGINPGNN